MQTLKNNEYILSQLEVREAEDHIDLLIRSGYINESDRDMKIKKYLINKYPNVKLGNSNV